MPPSAPPLIAIIADAHFHDVYGDYDFAGIPGGTGRMALRPLADTARSTRVFNESHSALRHALDDIVRRGIRHVVLLGDYSDDGQATTVAGVRRLIDAYRSNNGMHFYATTGNHDIFGATGRHRTKRFSNGDGRYTLVTSNPAMDDPKATARIVTDTMFCHGYPAGLRAMPGVGFFREGNERHWETPFGRGDGPQDRLYTVSSPNGSTQRILMDGSYLVEPFDDVWLLMIDANVFEPHDGAFCESDAAALMDSSDAGWNAMLRHKQFILDWMADVSARAAALGKQVLAFSHYPVLDPLDGTAEDEMALLGRTSLAGRIPSHAVAEAVSAAGIRIHFSGHLHVNDTARYQDGAAMLVNISVPSLVAFPPAYKVVGFEPDRRLRVSTVGLAAMSLDVEIMAVYRAEAAATGLAAGGMLEAGSYGGFMSAHIGHLVGRRFLRREWPQDLADAVCRLTLADVAVLAFVGDRILPEHAVPMLRAARAREAVGSRFSAFCDTAGMSAADLERLPVMTFLQDWYRLRMGSDLALDYIAADTLAVYDAVARLYARGEETSGLRHQFTLLLRMFRRFRTGLPSRDFTVDLSSGRVEAWQAHDHARPPIA